MLGRIVRTNDGVVIKTIAFEVYVWYLRCGKQGGKVGPIVDSERVGQG